MSSHLMESYRYQASQKGMSNHINPEIVYYILYGKNHICWLVWVVYLLELVKLETSFSSWLGVKQGLTKSWYKSPPTVKINKLVGGFNPSEKYSSKWESSPNRGEKKKYLKPPRFIINKKCWPSLKLTAKAPENGWLVVAGGCWWVFLSNQQKPVLILGKMTYLIHQWVN